MDYQSLYIDESNSLSHPALVTPDIRSSQGRLVCNLYPATGKSSYPVVVFTHGFPGHEKNQDIAQALRRIGYHVFIFSYSGSWGSNGSYSLSHCLEDTASVLEFIFSDTLYHFDTDNVFLVGHSYGCFIAAKTMCRYPQLKAAAFLMPCDLGQIYLSAQGDEAESDQFSSNLREGAEYLSGTDAESLLSEIKEDPIAFSFVSLTEGLAHRPILWVSSQNDTLTSEKVNTFPFMDKLRDYPDNKVTWHRIHANHYYLDQRIQLSKEIAQFFEKQRRQTRLGLTPEAFQKELAALIDRDYKSLTLSAAADHYHMSASYLSSIIRDIYGKSFTSVILDRKMREAGRLLRETKHSVEMIAEITGYNSAPYFINVFKKYYGCSPSRYRKQENSGTQSPDRK